MLLTKNYVAQHNNFSEMGGDTPLLLAIKHCHSIDTILLLRKNPSVLKITDSHENLPLHITLQQGWSIEHVNLMMDEDMNALRKPNCHGDLPLHIALKSKLPDATIDFLLDKDSSMLLTRNSVAQHNNSSEMCGDTPMLLAIKHGHSMDTILLLRTNPMVLEIPDSRGNLPLHVAIQQGWSMEHVSLMIPRNTSVHSKNAQGMTPLHMAAKHDVDIRVFMLLIPNSLYKSIQHKHGQYEDIIDMRPLRDAKGRTPLLTAVRKNLSFEKISLLIDQDRLLLFGADNAAETPFYAAMYSNASKDVVDLLLPKGMLPDLRITKNKVDMTPLMSALINSRPLDIIQQCIDPEHQHVLFMKIPVKHPITPLQYVMRYKTCVNRVQLVEALIDKKHKILSLKDANGRLPLHCALLHACHKNAIQLVQLLFPRYHKTAMALPAAEYNSAKVAKMARDKFTKAQKTYVEMMTYNGNTPLHLAIKHNYDENVLGLMVRQCGAGKNIILQQLDRHGNTALCCAIKRNMSVQVLNLLIDDDQNVLFIHENTGNTGTNEKNYPLHMVIQQIRTDGAVSTLLDKNRQILQKTNHALQTPLHLALHKCPYSSILRTLLGPTQYHARKSSFMDDALQVPDARGYTVLQRAVICLTLCHIPVGFENNWLGIMNDMIDTDRNVLLMYNEYDECPLHVALESVVKHNELSPRLINLNLLLDHHKNVLLKKDYNKATPLNVAVGLGCINETLLCALLDTNENALSMPDIHGSTPLHTAIEVGKCNVNVLQLLSGHKPRHLWDKKNSRGQTPLCVALYHKHGIDIITFLLCSLQFAPENAYSIFTSIDRHDRTPLHVALLQDAVPSVINTLLQGPQNVLYMYDKQNNMPLHVALQKDRNTMTNVLSLQEIERLKDPFQLAILWPNEAGNTPLHLAIENFPMWADFDYIAVLRSLIDDHSTVLGKVNVAGKTPLEMLPEQLNLIHVDEKQMWVEIHRLCNERAVMMQLEYV